MLARDFRARAREALVNNWGLAIVVCLLAGILSGGFNLSSATGGVTINVDIMEVEMGQGGLIGFMSRPMWAMLMTITIVSSLVALVIGGVINMGRCTYFTKLIRHEQAGFGDLFCHFNRLWDGIKMQFVMGIVILFWTLLLIIPGIIAAYSYAMVPYLMAEFPDLGVLNSMRESKRLMRGNRWRLFCLEFSFIGWNLLSVLTLGILSLWIAPYLNASMAAFYMEVTGRSGCTRTQEPRQQEQQKPWLNGPEL